MSDWTPLAILAVALGGAWGFAILEQLFATGRARPLAPLRDGAAMVTEPFAAPQRPDAWLYHLAPPLLLGAAVLTLATVPWAPGFRGIDLEAGITVFAAGTALVTPAVFMAGWGGGAALGVLAGFRFVALMLGYAMLVAMTTTAVAAPAASLRPATIVDVQGHTVPTILAQPWSFALFVPAVVAIALLPPLDLAAGSDELAGGAFARYAGVHAAIVGLARRVMAVAVAGMTAALFLAGWHGPLLPPAAWMALKTVAVAALFVWGGRRLPRPPIDRLVALAWKAAIPAAIVAIVVAGLEALLLYR